MVDRNIIETLRAATTPVIADVFDNLGITPPILATDLTPNRPGPISFAGPAFTVEGRMEETVQKGDPAKLRAIDDMSESQVALWAGNDMSGVCCFGDLLASAMKIRGVAGVVVDGGIRDMGFMSELDLPIMFRYRTPAQAIGRWRVVSAQKTVRVAGGLKEYVSVSPGDLIIGDDDGVIAVPSSIAGKVAGLAKDWATKDVQARADILKGMKLVDAFSKHGPL